jgi:3-oxoacyl-ACP reductase-like protein
MDDLVSIIQAMKTEIRLLKEKNVQHEEYIKKVESQLAAALEAKAAAEAKVAVAEETAVALAAAAAITTNELNASKVDPEDSSQNQQQELVAAQSEAEALLQGQSEEAASVDTDEPKRELLITDVSKDESGTNGYVINVCVTNQVKSIWNRYTHNDKSN